MHSSTGKKKPEKAPRKGLCGQFGGRFSAHLRNTLPGLHSRSSQPSCRSRHIVDRNCPEPTHCQEKDRWCKSEPHFYRNILALLSGGALSYVDHALRMKAAGPVRKQPSPQRLPGPPAPDMWNHKKADPHALYVSGTFFGGCGNSPAPLTEQLPVRNPSSCQCLKRNGHRAPLGQFFTHSMQRMHSVPFFRFLELSVTSTFIGHTRLHFPHEMHFSLSHFTLSRAK